MILDMVPTIETASVTDLRRVVEDHHRFWGDRDLRAGHIAVLVLEFGSTCFVVRDGADEILAYLIGFVTPDRVGYVHLVATRDDARGLGLARHLYEEFAAVAKKQGAIQLKAITSRDNSGSVDFHRRLGFRDEIVDDYWGPGKSMIVFHRDLPAARP